MRASEIRSLTRQNLAGKWRKAALATLIFGLIVYAISFVLTFIPVVGPIISAILSVPLSFGLLFTMFKLNDGEEISYVSFLNEGFAKFGKVWSVTLHMFLKLIIPVILVAIFAALSTFNMFYLNSSLSTLGSFALYIITVIYMVYKSLLYTFSLYVLIDNPEITGKEAVNKSAELMKGNIWEYICLNLSFIGWGILAILPFLISCLIAFVSFLKTITRIPTISPLAFNLIIFSVVIFITSLLWLIPYMRIAKINFYRNLDGQI